MFKTLTKLALASLVGAALGISAHAQEMTLKFQSSDPAGNPNFILQQGWAESVSEKTGGRLAIELLPVESIVAHNETQDAIAAGILDGHVTDTSYFAGKDPAFGLIANPVGAWSAPQEMFDFMSDGGGKELMNELLEPYGLRFIGATTPGLEAFVSKVPLTGVDDLQGLKMRAPEGLVQQVFAAAGAAPVNLPGSEVFTSLDKGVIDAADYSVFSTNQAQGMHDVAPNPVYPGFHSMPLVEISMNKAKWDALPEDMQAALEESVAEFALSQVAALAAKDEEAVAAAKAGGEVTVHDWPAEERAKFRTIATGEWAKVAERSENAQRVYEVLTGYLKENGMMN
ncbi:MAG: TRAP transporter substrate-binding protein [Roseitalea sp.]|jgi:TRAP-type mannitol/chloroaromatic compound transport system substrate-binding protein|uniref:TRAP transporter substrate-binding protein n=1 Tax=Oceaniradius stylonematis TaxID=2184161 RepID=A0A3A8AJR3_9HYPH|nr:TRAP transporter substrate-binding protein [Oceaniradius stylonematis]MBO6551675.1 TRAP transporter substrate-binding protein [Roseitalea sp.]MBO6951945.1 TRAP transporter substrate-binding protein [Rhizobiaceae bacterium]RNC95640.1 MAG: TRAP transporter substrate-binding protein [Oricola sp.]MBO6592209.1 TRAP transporter substrate-binding protein [Roseitalea sp.]MBO6598464.1 TRAP transporter substrate-binding protein [Roseitalea sp.]